MDSAMRQRRGEEEVPLGHPAARAQDAGEKDKYTDEVMSRRGRNMVLVILLYVAIVSAVFIWFQVGREPTKVLVLSVSGLRHDYLGKIASKDAPFLTQFLREGSRAEYLSPAFGAGSEATRATMFTGQHPAQHGVLGHHFMDRLHGELHVHGPAGHSADDATWWSGKLPIWNSAVKQWRKSAVINVHGGCVPFDGYTTTHCQTPDPGASGDDPFSENLSRALDLLLSEEHNYAFAVVHTDILQRAAETNGADSKGVLDELRTLDTRLSQMDDLLRERQMLDKINIVIVSDGGLKDTQEMEVVQIDSYLPPDEVSVTITGNGAVCLIYTEHNNADIVFGVLTNMPGARAYRRKDIPERYHFDNENRAPDVLLVADPDTYIENTEPLTVAAAGGYDDTEGNVPEMRGVLMGRGPSFRKGVLSGPVRAVDVYTLLATLLDITSEIHSGDPTAVASFIDW